MAKEPLMTPAEYRALTPLFKEHRRTHAPDAVIGGETTAESETFLDTTIDRIDGAEIQDQKAAEANGKRDEQEIKTDEYFSKYVNWIKGEFSARSLQAKALPKRFHTSKGSSNAGTSADPSH